MSATTANVILLSIAGAAILYAAVAAIVEACKRREAGDE